MLVLMKQYIVICCDVRAVAYAVGTDTGSGV